MEYSRENGIELIVMNTHGHSGFRRLIMGSVADRVIRSVEVPVLHPTPIMKTSLVGLDANPLDCAIDTVLSFLVT